MDSRFVTRDMPIMGVKLIDVSPHSDERGSFFRVYCKREFAGIGIESSFVQMNQSINLKKGTFRGLHYQKKPFGEGKMVKCSRGSVIDFFLDLRSDSPTFMKHGKAKLSEENQRMIYLPKGIAHGFITLEDNTHLLYYHTEYFVPESQETINYQDPRIALEISEPVRFISSKDKNASYLSDDFSGF